jgi:hypothetical protein
MAGVRVGVAVGEAVGVAVAVGLGCGVGDAVGDGEGDADGVAVDVGVAVGDALAVAVADGDGVGVAVAGAVGVAVAVTTGGGLKSDEPEHPASKMRQQQRTKDAPEKRKTFLAIDRVGYWMRMRPPASTTPADPAPARYAFGGRLLSVSHVGPAGRAPSPYRPERASR